MRQGSTTGRNASALPDRRSPAYDEHGAPKATISRLRFGTSHDRPVDAAILPRAGGFRLREGGCFGGILRPAWDLALPRIAGSPLCAGRNFGWFKPQLVASRHFC
jgi:hypothetical protein